MFSNCIVHCGFWAGGASVFGCWCDGPMNGHSLECCRLDVVDDVREDSDVGDELLLCAVVVSGVIVSAREHEMKHPCTRGCFFQASVDSF